ncbi:uncharacterized protein DUF2482 [Staphylococcus hominis]
MTKEIKDMTQEEVKEIFTEKTEELVELIKKVDNESEFDINVFSIFGVATEKETSATGVVYGNIHGLADLLNNEEKYHEIDNVIKLYELQNAVENMTFDNSESE